MEKPNFSISLGTLPKMTKLLKHISVGLFFLLLLLLGISSYRDYGISWDETKQRLTGAVTLKYLAEAFHVPASRVPWKERLPSLATYQDRDYGVAFEAPAFALEQLLRLKDFRDVYMFRHLLTFLVFFAGVCAVYRLALRRFSDWRIGLLSALFLLWSRPLGHFVQAFKNMAHLRWGG